MVWFKELIFPRICVTCKGALSRSEYNLCQWCSEKMFEPANPTFEPSCNNVILPEYVEFQHALWRYDKGGYLQELLHALKYKNMPGVGVDMGRALGVSLSKHPALSGADSVRLIPVPLHPKKKRIRGYNQAAEIAIGISEVTHFEMIQETAVERTRHTKTQTGFTLKQRQENLASAFRVSEPYSISRSHLVIIDDVYTTGATTFELAAALQLSSKFPIGIATVAMA